MLSLMRALWEQVTADLRGVAVAYEGSPERGCVRARFLYESDVGEVQADCTSLAESYCIADFPPAVSVMFFPVPNASRDLQPGEEWAFMRWEAEA